MGTITPLGQAAPAAPDPVAMISALLDAEKVTPDTPVKAETPAQPEKDAPAPANNAQVEGEDAPKDEGDKPPVAEIPLDQLEAIELETTYVCPLDLKRQGRNNRTIKHIFHRGTEFDATDLG